MAKLPFQQNILNALLENMPLLIRVFAFLIFFWLLFAIVGVRLFQGSLRRQCFLDDGIFETGTQGRTYVYP